MDAYAALFQIPGLLGGMPFGAQPFIIQPSAQSQQVEELQNLNRTFQECTSKIDSIGNELIVLIGQGNRQVIDKLELAMSKIYKLAIFIRGDYDQRNRDDADTQLKQDLTAGAVAAFEEVEQISEQILSTIGRKHAELTELESTLIAPSKQKTTVLREQINTESQSVQDQLQEIDRTINNLQQNIAQQTYGVHNLRERIEETRNAQLASDIGFSILTLGIGNLINDGPLDPANLGGQLNDAENALRSSERDLNGTVSKQMALMQQKAQLQQRLETVSAVDVLSPGIRSNAESISAKCVMLQSQFGSLKEAASRLVSKVSEVEQGATTSYGKKEFAAGLLGICSDSLMDSALTDEAKLVRDEVINEYGAPVPDEITQTAAAVDQKIQLVTNVPSIRGY